MPLYIDQYLISFIQYGDIPIRASLPPHPNPCPPPPRPLCGRPHHGAGFGGGDTLCVYVHIAYIG